LLVQNGTLKEIFGAGTAAVVNPIIGFSYQEVIMNYQN
jgi:branched-chain amino acid aminotransferase